MPSDKPPMASIKTTENSVTVTFSNGHVIIGEYDKLSTAMQRQCGVAGLAAFLRTSYSNADNVDEAVGDVQTRLDGLLSGKWSPNTRVGVKEPDELARAVCEAVDISYEVYEATFLPKWLASRLTETTTKEGETRMLGRTKALNELRAHPQIAPVLARYAAERAKAGRGKEGPNLLDFATAQQEAA